MITSSTTWGALREIHKRAIENPEMDVNDDYLSNPDFADRSVGKLDTDLVFDNESVSDTVKFYLAVVEGTSDVSMLLKIDSGTGYMSYRESGDWVDVTPDDDIPELDLPYTEVTGDATEVWDANPDAPLESYDSNLV